MAEGCVAAAVPRDIGEKASSTAAAVLPEQNPAAATAALATAPTAAACSVSSGEAPRSRNRPVAVWLRVLGIALREILGATECI